VTPSPEIDTSVPHSARIWNYWLGGKDNYPVDQDAGDAFCEIFPGIVDIARSSRYLLARMIRFLAEAGITQFLDVGTGLPTVDNTHEVAQRLVPAARVVYVDNDPLVLAHARALLTSTPEGVTNYIDADLRDPGRILRLSESTLDLTRPVGLMLMGILGHVTGYDLARGIVVRLMEALPSGSYLCLYDSTDTSEASIEAHRRYNEGGSVPYHLRSPEQLAGFFEGLELVEPGIVPVPRWRPEVTPLDAAATVDAYCGVGRKP
jgi:SAM-dependent methyltransferase